MLQRLVPGESITAFSPNKTQWQNKVGVHHVSSGTDDLLDHCLRFPSLFKLSRTKTHSISYMKQLTYKIKSIPLSIIVDCILEYWQSALSVITDSLSNDERNKMFL